MVKSLFLNNPANNTPTLISLLQKSFFEDCFSYIEDLLSGLPNPLLEPYDAGLNSFVDHPDLVKCPELKSRVKCNIQELLEEDDVLYITLKKLMSLEYDIEESDFERLVESNTSQINKSYHNRITALGLVLESKTLSESQKNIFKKHLIEKGAGLKQGVDDNGNTMLHVNFDPTLLHHLITLDSEKELLLCKNKQGQTPLEFTINLLSKDYIGEDKGDLILSLSSLATDSDDFSKNLSMLASQHKAPDLLIAKINFLLSCK